MSRPMPAESFLIWMMGAIQFTNILDFMMVMPLGPDFSVALRIPSSSIGWISGSYTFAAALTGFVAVFFMDRFDRRRVLLTCLLGLILATAFCGLAWNFHSLMFGRFLAGCFGGPLSSTSVSIIADVIPFERRGRAMGKVMGAFSVASVLGVPFGLEMARLFNWRAPFFALSFLAIFVFIFSYRRFPAMRDHLREVDSKISFEPLLHILKNPNALLSYLMLGFAMTAAFLIIPNIATHLQFNLHFNRDYIGYLYMAGGVASFFVIRLAGIMIDQWGVFKVSVIACLVSTIAIYIGYIGYERIQVPVIVFFVLFMISTSTRNISSQTLSSKIPSAKDRGSYTSLQSSVVHIFTSLGAFLSSLLLTSGENHSILGMPRLGMISIAIGIFNPWMVWILEKRLKTIPQK